MTREEKNMSILEKELSAHIQKIRKIAQANTVKNSDGLTVITKDDPYREDPDFESSIKSTGSNQ